MSDTLVIALTGADPAALREDVTLATPLALPRVSGREQVVAVLQAYAGLFAPGSGDLQFKGVDMDGAVLTTTVDGHTAQVIGLVTYDDAGLVATIDVYGRPWPYMALVRDRLGAIDPGLAIPDLGTVPYVPDGPGTAWIAAPPLPPISESATFVSPLLTAVATGKVIVERILEAATQCYGKQRFRAVLQAEGATAVAAVFDGTVEGHALQLVAIFTLDDRSEISEVRIFSRPWPVTAYFRRDMHELLREDLGPEYWQGPDPEAPLPVK